MIQVYKVTHNGKSIEFEVIRGNRVKTSEIVVEPNKVIVRAPAKKSINEIKEIVKRKADWIAKKQQEYQSLALEIANPSFEHNSTLPYLGSNYKLQVFTSYKNEKIRLVGGEFLFTLTSEKADAKRIQTLYESWLMARAEALFLSKVKEYASKIGVHPKRIIIKKLRKRWGSATQNGILNLNVNLLKAPEDVIDYVILHELCHLKIKDHSHRFWNLVGSQMPNYKQKAEWLSTNVLGMVE